MLRLQSLLYAIVPVPGTVRSLRDVSGEPCENHGLLRNCKFTVIATHTRGNGERRWLRPQKRTKNESEYLPV